MMVARVVVVHVKVFFLEMVTKALILVKLDDPLLSLVYLAGGLEVVSLF